MSCVDLTEIGFFEGTEKLLEIWFEDSSKIQECDLRAIPRYELDNLLKIVNAEIVSHTYNEFIDSYVLSESSMFISKDRFIIKTCGITRMLCAVEPILELARQYAGMCVVQNFFYSRRIYLRPDEQPDVHKAFGLEVDFLKEIIPEGKPYVFGKNEEEQWYLFSMVLPNSQIPLSDTTLEVLMSDLDEEAMSNFTAEKYKSSEELIENTGISWLIPGSVNDGLVFDPIGYSLNGLFNDSYYTIHVTPQSMCSYVSFETNIQLRDYRELIDKLLSLFKPRKFIITLISNQDAICGNAGKALERTNIEKFECKDECQQNIETFSLAYRFYEKKSTSL